MQITKRSRRVGVGAAVVALLTAIPIFTLVTGNSAQAAVEKPGDGTTSATAGASCWGIKQQYATSATGIYWLNNAALERPTQFYCDMTTDGGGWVLVGRGREGWTFNPFGQGSPATVRNTPDGTAAFTPAALPSSQIDALLNGGAVSDLADGIRIERATDKNGNNRQDVRMFPRYARWSWNFPAGNLLNKVQFDNVTYNGSNTQDTAASVFGQTTNGASGQSGSRRLFTFSWASHDKKMGFSHGSGVSGGSNAATNYLWQYANEGSPIPFARVRVRPRIANGNAGFTPLPAAGFPAEAKPAGLKNKSETAPWGVVGMDHTNETTIEPWNTNVLALRVLGDRTFVGGRFTGVQQGPTGTAISQPSLAAFDLDGNFIDTFRPQIAGRVWDMVATSDGKLLIAGDFTSVNGNTDAQGIAKLDPATGQLVAGFKAKSYNVDGTRSFVHGLAIRDGIVYAVGNFNRFAGSTWNAITVSRAVSLDEAAGAPGSWRPRLSGQGVRVRVTDDKTRVLVVGYFNNINNVSNHGYFGITDIATGTPLTGIGPWTPSIGSNKTYQQAVADLGDRMIVGGSEHNIQLWNRDRTTLLDPSVTKAGGDTQAIELIGGKAYIACHCGDWVYQGTNNWSAPTGFRAIETINLVGAFTPGPNRLDVDTSWFPSGLKGVKGEGVWAIDSDSRGCLWVGGDLNRGGFSGNAAADYLGGFARFCQLDATPPTAPTNLTQAVEGAGVKLSWGASTDDSGTVSYDVYRDDRVIATVWGTSYTDPEVTGTHRYTVRATDARGNRSASPAPINVNGPSPVLATPVAFASTWRYLADGTDAGTAWRAPGFSDGTWASGPGRLGWGLTPLGTTVGGTTRPITSYYRKTFDVSDAASVRTMSLQMVNMQGAVVYVNGVEAGRLNMPAGKVSSSTAAAGYLPTSQETTVKTLTVPGSLLRNGTNTLAVEVHNVTVSAGRSLFDLQATLYGQGGDATAPTAPSLTASSTFGSASLSWTPATDDAVLAGYLIERDGAPLAVTGPAATTFTDGEVDTAASHTYVVRAFDLDGNVQASNSVTVAPLADPNLLAYGSTWRWFYAEGGPTADWAQPGYADGAWASGPAELGYGDSDEKTVISTAPTPRPLTAYFRTVVNVSDPSAFTAVVASLVRDDGAVLYVNGVEVGRDNLPAGAIGFSTPASTIISDRSAERTPVTFTIPASAFQPGANVIAVEVHNSDRWSGDLSMDLKLTGQL